MASRKPGSGAAVGLVTLSEQSPILDVQTRTYGEFAGDMTIEMDPPRHTEMRALVSRSFTPRRVAEMEQPTRELARELLATAGPSFDAIEDFAGQLPMAVISTVSRGRLRSGR